MIVLGADIGGTAARVVLFDGESERGRADGAGRPMRTGEGAELAETIAALARPLLRRGRAARADVLVVGAAGAGGDAERSELREALEHERLAWRTIVTTDAELARAAAFGGAPGVLVIAGTGSIAVSRDARGLTHRVGGLGWRMGDHGSAYWIGARALEAVGAMHDALGPTTHLAEALCGAARVAGIGALVRWSVRATPAEVAALATAVLGAADAGDRVANGIREAAVKALASLAMSAGGDSLPIALSGGLLAPGRPLRERLTVELERNHRATVLGRAVDPCIGALALAAHPDER